MTIKRTDWHKKIIRNAQARIRYYMNRYGNLDRMHAKQAKFEKQWDDDSWQDELDEQELKNTKTKKQ